MNPLKKVNISRLGKIVISIVSKISLLGRVAIAIVLGVLFGLFFSDTAVRIFATFNSLFENFLRFSIPLIIAGLIIPAISDMGKSAGKLLLITVALAYASTLFSGFFTFSVCSEFFRQLLPSDSSLAILKTKPTLSEPFFTIAMPPMFEVTAALIFSFIIGLGLSKSSRDNALLQASRVFQDIMIKLINVVIIPLLPLFIFGIFLNMSKNEQAWELLKLFSKVIIVIFILHVVLLLIEFFIAGAIAKRNPFILLKNMLPAYATALGTQSSAATIPVTLKQTIKNKVNVNVAEFTIPLCATIHLAGSTMKIVACSIAVMIVAGMPFDFFLYLRFILMLSITMVAAPGVPGGAIMAALGVLGSILGFDGQLQGLMIGLYIAMDSFGTACNVTGDGAISVIVDKIINPTRRQSKLEVS